jgi:hypothetical protein
MSSRAVSLDDHHFRIAQEKARALGKTPQQYLQSLIDADSQSFDEILEPVRQGFEKMSDGEVDDLLGRAQKHSRRKDTGKAK